MSLRRSRPRLAGPFRSRQSGALRTACAAVLIVSSAVLTGFSGNLHGAGHAGPEPLGPAAAGGTRPEEGGGRLPAQPMMFFERNQGQYRREVQYAARGAAFGLALEQNGIRFFRAGQKQEWGQGLGIRFRGAAAEAVRGIDAVGANVSHFRGAKGFTAIPAFSRVQYRNLWNGIDLEVYSKDSRFEYDFIVHPGADFRDIRLEVSGAGSVTIGEEGDLILEAWGVRLRQRAPVAYQETGGGRAPVASRFRLWPDRTVSFEVEQYERDLPLVIDPVFVYASYLGGSGFDEALSIATDNAGNVYLAGVTGSLDFPLAGPPLQTGVKDLDLFVAKLNPAGTELLYATYLGGNGTETVAGMAVDSAGTVYLAGSTDSGNFPVTPGAAYPSYKCCGGDGFIARLAADGSALLYSTYLGGTGSDYLLGMSLDGSGAVYFAGQTNSADLPVTASAVQKLYGGGEWDGFAGKLNAAGTQLVWLTYLGGSGNDYVRAAAVDGAGQFYVAGASHSADFPTTASAWQRTLRGSRDGFVTAYNAAGNARIYATLFGGALLDEISALGVLSTGEVVFGGGTTSLNLPVTAGVHRSAAGPAYLASLDKTGGALRFCTYFEAVPAALKLDSNGRIGLAGTVAEGLPTSSGAYAVKVRAVDHPADAYFALMDSQGRGLEYSSYFGGGSEDRATALALSTATAWIAGLTRSSDLPAPPQALRRTPGGGAAGTVTDAFLAKIDLSRAPAAVSSSAGPLLFAQQLGGSAAPAQNIALSTADSGVSYRAIALSPGWLKVTAGEGAIAAGATANIGVSVDAQGLALGSYDGQVLVELMGAAGGVRSVPVRLLVTAEKLALRLDRSSVNLVTQVGENPPAVPLTVTDSSPSGAEGVAFTVSYLNVGLVWFTVEPKTGRTRGDLSVSINASGLAAGNYAGVITVTPQGVDSPAAVFTINLSVKAGASLRLVPQQLAFTYQTGGSLPRPQVFEVQSTGAPLALQLRTNPDQVGWLSFPYRWEPTPLAQYVTVNPAGLSPGTYLAQIEVISAGASNSPQVLPVSLTVTGPPAMAAGTASLSFGAKGGMAAPPAQWVAVTSAPAGVTFTAQAVTESGGAWLSVSPDAATTPANLAVMVQHRILSAGQYRGAVVLRSAQTSSPEIRIPVNLLVDAAAPYVHARVGVYSNGNWLLDLNGNDTWNGVPTDAGFSFQLTGTPVVGDWNGTGRQKSGIFSSNGVWRLDFNGNHNWDGPALDREFQLGSPGAIPVVGDWNGDGRTKIGVYGDGVWLLDYNGNYQWEEGIDKRISMGWGGAIPVVGDWNGDGKTKIGVYSGGFWFLDYNGDFVWNPGAGDKQVGWGWPGVQIVTGDWNGDGKTKIGVYSGGFWFLDYNGDFVWNPGAGDKQVGWGWPGVQIVTGDWNGDGKTKIGVVNQGFWFLDYDGNYAWDGGVTDKISGWGAPGDTPVPGIWGGASQSEAVGPPV